MTNFIWYILAAFLEIAGCFGLWMWVRLGRSPLWSVPSTLALVLFGLALTRVQAGFAGRAFAAYGGVYIVSSLVWLSVVERAKPTLSDLAGAVLCLLGAALILYGPRLHAA